MAQDQTSSRLLGSVEKAIAVLEALATGGEPLGTNEIARRVGVNASTTSRLLATLAAAGYVEREAASGRFRLGVRLLQLGTHVLAHLDVRRLARPLLVEIEEATGETATLSLPAGGEAVTVDYVPSRSAVRSVTPIGRPSIAHATAVGKVMLAFDRGAVALLPQTLERFTPATVVDHDRLARALDGIRAAGRATAVGEREPDLNAVAAPVLDHTGGLAAILGVQGPRGRFEGEALERAGDLVVDAAARLSQAIGHDLAP